MGMALTALYIAKSERIFMGGFGASDIFLLECCCIAVSFFTHEGGAEEFVFLTAYGFGQKEGGDIEKGGHYYAQCQCESVRQCVREEVQN